MQVPRELRGGRPPNTLCLWGHIFARTTGTFNICICVDSLQTTIIQRDPQTKRARKYGMRERQAANIAHYGVAKDRNVATTLILISRTTSGIFLKPPWRNITTGANYGGPRMTFKMAASQRASSHSSPRICARYSCENDASRGSATLQKARTQVFHYKRVTVGRSLQGELSI